MELIEPDDGQALCTQGMKSVVDCDFRRTMLMGSMWMSCSNLSNSTSALSRSMARARTQ